MSLKEFYIGFVVFAVVAVLAAAWADRSSRPCTNVTILVPGPVAVIRVDGSTILVNEKEFTLPAGDTRFTVRVMDGKPVKAINRTAHGVEE